MRIRRLDNTGITVDFEPGEGPLIYPSEKVSFQKIEGDRWIIEAGLSWIVRQISERPAGFLFEDLSATLPSDQDAEDFNKSHPHYEFFRERGKKKSSEDTRQNVGKGTIHSIREGQVYPAIDKEREAQDIKHPGMKTIPGEIVLIQRYLQRLANRWAEVSGSGAGDRLVKKYLRIIAAIAVRAMENTAEEISADVDEDRYCNR